MGERAARRPDIPVKEVALQWLDGNTIEVLCDMYECSANSIKLRLKKAREQFPELPWDSRRTVLKRDSFSDYVEMKDGVPGTRGVRPGSVIKSSASRRR